MLAKDRPRHIVKRRRGTRCMRGRERKVQSDLEINKLGRGGHDGGTRNRQIRRRFPERAWRDQGLQSRTAEEMQIHRNKEVRWAKGDRKSTEKTTKEQVRMSHIRAHMQSA